jgi:formate hydrogenlyase subunit 5
VIQRSIWSDALVETASELRREGWRLATIAVTDPEIPEMRYVFCGPQGQGWQQLIVRSREGNRTFPSLTPTTVSADWLEREIEDLFAIDFAEHPRLGDFVLHDQLWAEGIGPMRPGAAIAQGRVEREWQPRRVLQEEGAFVMPVGPVYSGHAESALFLLETVGEDVVRAVPRLFYKYRGIEKLAQGRDAADAMLLVERANGTSAFANSWAYCIAAERIFGVEIPARAARLRALIAEIERVRRHVAVLRETVESTGMLVAAAQLFELEEWLLRACDEMTGHRYLFGLNCVGGLQRNVADAAVYAASSEIGAIAADALETMRALQNTSSFLDRIEDVGILREQQAEAFGAVGPFARASNVLHDLRIEQPYGSYADVRVRAASAREGDGYARLRVLRDEIERSLELLAELSSALPPGAVRVACTPRAGEALGWVEAPSGACVVLLQLDEEGRCENLRFTPPSFRNWQCFRLVAEDFAFQDLAIILATCGLSVAENDR